MPTKSNNTGGRGGKRPGAGHKPKSNLEKVQNGNLGGRKLTMLDIPDVEGIQMPKPNELLSAKQRDGTELRAKQIYEDTWNWLNSIDCAGYVSPQTIERYAMCVWRDGCSARR